MKTLLPLIALAAACAMPPAHAGNLIDLSVIDRDTGAVLPTHARDGKVYVAGTPGHRYSVRIANHLGERVLAILSVDGVNAISGETAAPDQSGYVLGAYESTEIGGWRKSSTEVAQFNFTALGASYAARTGRPDNVGVIGVAVFREKPVSLPWREGKIATPPLADRAAPAAPAASAAPSAANDAAAAQAPASGSLARAETAAVEKRRPVQPQESLGTGHGAREYSAVAYTEFERATTQPAEVASIWYDSYGNLVARGVIPSPRPKPLGEPQPFPGGFVPDPAS